MAEKKTFTCFKRSRPLTIFLVVQGFKETKQNSQEKCLVPTASTAGINLCFVTIEMTSQRQKLLDNYALDGIPVPKL